MDAITVLQSFDLIFELKGNLVPNVEFFTRHAAALKVKKIFNTWKVRTAKLGLTTQQISQK